MASSTEPISFTRLPFTGSCHCKTIRYIVYLRLIDLSKLHADTKVDAYSYSSATGGQSQYRCNCTLCHKMGFLHLRLPSAPDDFFVLAPTDPSAEDSGVGSYKDTWYFCKTCGVRCFTTGGQMERTEAQFPVEMLEKVDMGDGVEEFRAADGLPAKRVPVWKPKKEGWIEFPAPGANSYLSVNMCTLDADQEGLDLRSFHKEGWIGYCGMLKGDGGFQHVPFEGGMY